jgi:hypothetical protein
MNEPLERDLRAYLGGDRFAADPDLADRVRRRLPEEAAGAATRSPRTRRRQTRLAAAAAGLVAAAVVTATVAQAMGSPIPAGLLRAVGLAPTAVSVPSGGEGPPERATAAGHTLMLLGAYGDTLHTVIFVGGEPDLRFVMARLYDESGRELHPAAGSAAVVSGGDGHVAMQFEPLPVGPHRLTLRVQGLLLTGSVAMGAWELHPAVRVVEAARVPVQPASGTLGGVPVSITAVSGDGHAFFVTVETRGADALRLVKMTEGVPSPGAGAFAVRVTGPNGASVRQLGLPAPAPKDGRGGDQLDLVMTTYWQGSGPGTYRLVLTFEGQRMEATFTLS